MIKKEDECQRTWYLATGTSDMLKGKNISRHFVTGCLKNLRLFPSSLRMHEKSKNVPFLKDHLKSSHKYTICCKLISFRKYVKRSYFCGKYNSLYFTSSSFIDKQRLFGSYMLLFEKYI